MARYFVVKGLPEALVIEQNFITNRIKVKYMGEYLTEVVRGEYQLTFPDGSTKVLSYIKSRLGIEYPRVFVDRIEITYLIPLSPAQRVIALIPAIIIMTSGLLGVLFALFGTALITKIFKQVSNPILAYALAFLSFGFIWVIATMTSIYFL